MAKTLHAEPGFEERVEPVAVDNQLGDRTVDDVGAINVHFAASSGQELRGRDAVTGEVTVQVIGRDVPWATGVHHQDGAARPRQHQGRGQAGGTPSDHDDVVVIHAPRLEPGGRITYERCCFWENRVR